ncbi:MAG: cytochrome c3 family protein [Desulfosalsimonadaceae bacterium]
MKRFLFLFGVLCCVFVLMGCGQEEEAKQPAQEKGREAAESAKEQAKDTGEESAGDLEEAGKQARQTTEAAKEKAREAAETSKESAEESAESVKEKTEESVQGMKEKAGEAASAAKQKAEQTAEKTKQEIGQDAEAVKEKAAETAAAGGLGVMKMKNEKAFSQHRMGIVEFDHKAHVEEYGLGCGKCHHDKNHEPLNDLSYDDPVKSCFECHDKTGRPNREESMSEEQWQKERIKYYYGAIHENCMGCHKETKGPTQCTQCHPSPER